MRYFKKKDENEYRREKKREKGKKEKREKKKRPSQILQMYNNNINKIKAFIQKIG